MIMVYADPFFWKTAGNLAAVLELLISKLVWLLRLGNSG